MSEPIDDGGPAFPVIKSAPRKTEGFPGVWTEIKSVGGMSLRDWFAGQALAGVLGSAEIMTKIALAALIIKFG